MIEFFRFLARGDLGPILLCLLFVPLIALPIAPVVWLLVAAVDLAPMSWGGFLWNWLMLSVIFGAYFTYRRVKNNWLLFKSIREKAVLAESPLKKSD